MNISDLNAGQLQPRIDPARSALMARVRGKNTAPELIVRRMAHSLGYRFRLHRSDLPGTPDLVFVQRKAAIFVHGCFWHHHKHCSKATMPKTRVAFWEDKFAKNIARDKRARASLKSSGWRVLTIWECETVQSKLLAKRITAFLSPLR